MLTPSLTTAVFLHSISEACLYNRKKCIYNGNNAAKHLYPENVKQQMHDLVHKLNTNIYLFNI